jgi:internalin A
MIRRASLSALSALSVLAFCPLLLVVVACDEAKKPVATTPSASVTAAPSTPVAAASETAPAAPVKKKDVVCAPGPNVTFTMAGLEAEVRKKLAKPEGAITQADLAKVKSINLTAVPVDELDMCVFPHLKGVKDIFLGKGDLDDLSALASLTQLVSLRASINKVKSIEPLAHLTLLDRLDLGKTAVTDITPIASMTNLTELELDDTNVDSVAPLAKLTKLERLSIKNTAVKDLRPLVGLKKLRSLSIGGSPIDDTHVLDGLKGGGLKIEAK